MRLKQRWTLHVENLGKIKVADIEIGPMIFFVGDNNSGKSYLMSVLWGILTIGKEYFPLKGSTTEYYNKCDKWLIESYGINTDIDEATQAHFVGWFNELLERHKKDILKRIFNYQVDATKIRIEGFKRQVPVRLEWVDGAHRISTKSNALKFPLKDSAEMTREYRARMLAYICWNLLMQDLGAPLFTPIVRGKRLGEPVYLPASRTGLMLTKDTLYSYAVGRTYGVTDEEAQASPLTLPYTDFLKTIIQFDTSQAHRFQAVVEYIEKHMVQGKIEARNEPFPVVTYTPSGAKKDMPLHVTSSVVTELSPLLLILKSGIKFNLMIIEEPESHLHPKLQLQMARVLFHLVNQGVPVWVTTHSDTIIQHVNNIIKATRKGVSQKLLSEQAIYSKDLARDIQIKMYQFDVVDNRTDITELRHAEEGFVVPTFNEVYYMLLKQTRALHGGIE